MVCAGRVAREAQAADHLAGILAVLEQELVTRRQAVGREEFLRLYGLGRIVPSGTMTALAVAYGYRFAGLPGTVISLTALVLPALVLTVALTAVYGLVRQQQWLPELLPVTILPQREGEK